MRQIRVCAICCLIIFGQTGWMQQPEAPAVQAENPVIVIAAGVPKYLGEAKDYDQIFGMLAQAGVTAFMPTSQYQEVPEPLALGYEVDFLPPCDPTAPVFEALREHHLKLLLPGELLYPPGQMPPLEDDPLRALMDCAGEAQIMGVLSLDEPIKTGRTLGDVQALYERIKQVAPDLPVMMVHAPLVVEDRPLSQEEIDTYLHTVSEYNVYADWVGFDLYPIPVDIMPVLAPGQGTDVIPYTTAFPAYLDWLDQTANDKPYFMVLQAFSYRHLLDEATAQEAEAAGYVLPLPTEEELRAMACMTVEGGGFITWWGQSHLTAADAEFWETVLDVTRQVTTDPLGYCE